jgi:hypothetical protein
MTSYVMKNLQVDLVGNTASVCISCDGGKGPTVINMNFPMHVSSQLGEKDLRAQTRDKVKLVLTRALECIQQEA